MSKYEPLKGFLIRASGHEAPMTFAEIERILGFPLPSSARSHPAWWSNSHHNPAVQAWRQAGWSTSRLDLPGQKVVFVRDRSESRPQRLDVPLDALQPSALRLLTERARQDKVDLSTAAARLLNVRAAEGKRALLDRFTRRSPKLTTDSTPLIREDRDAR